MQPKDAAEIHELFFRASGSERISILHSLAETPLKAAPRIPDKLTKRAVETLEMAAFAADVENFKLEVSESLILPTRLAAELVDDAGGEPPEEETDIEQVPGEPLGPLLTAEALCRALAAKKTLRGVGTNG